MLLREFYYYSNNDISSALSDFKSKNSKGVFPCLDEINRSSIKLMVNSRMCINALQNVLDVGWSMYQLIQNHYEAIFYVNTVKLNK